MALKPADGHRHAHQAHRAHQHHHAHQTHAQHQGHAHQAQGAHKGADKPAKADKPDHVKQEPHTAHPQGAAGDQFVPQHPPPVNLTPGSSGEHQAPPAAGGTPTTGAAHTPPTGAAHTPPTGAAQTPTTGAAHTPTEGAAHTPTEGAAHTPTTPDQAQTAKPPSFQWISQMDPKGAGDDYDNGMANCGPTAGAMVARACGYGADLDDAALVEKLAGFGQTTAEGTSGNGVIAMYEEMGLQTAASPGANLDWINNELTAGHYVTALGDYYAVPGRVDESLTSGHYVDVTAYHKASKKHEARYSVADPADKKLNYMTTTELQKYITSAPNGGFAISAWEEEAAAAAAASVA